MDPNVPGTRRYFFEYLYQQAIERTKELLDRPIMISAARKLRLDLEEELRRRNTSFDQWQPSEIASAIDETLGQIEGYVPMFDKGAKSEAYLQTFGQFANMIGMTFNNRVADPGPSGPRLPISPYDPRWSNRATVQRAGANLSYLLADDIEQVLANRIDFAHRYRGDAMGLYQLSPEGQAFPSGKIYTIDDMAGLTQLMRYIPRKDYNEIRSWVIEASRNADGRFDPDQFMTPEALERSVAILQYLQDEGIGYRVVKDRRPGQIAARIDGTKISVRLTDRADNESYVGRVYDNGMRIYFSTNQRLDATNRQAPYTPDVRESVDLLKAALGETIVRDNGSVVGINGSFTVREGGQEIEHQTSYYTLKKEGDSYIPNSGERVHMMVYKTMPNGSQVFIRKNAKDRSMGQNMFRTRASAEQFLEEAIQSAQANIVSGLNVDYLIEQAQLHKDDPDWIPELSGDSELAAIQRSYWDVLTGKKDVLLRPHATREDFEDATSVLAELQLDDGSRAATAAMLAGGLMYGGTPEEMVRAHLEQVPLGMVGDWSLHEVTLDDASVALKRFDPVRVAKYMTSESGPWRNTTDLVAAMRIADIKADELLGQGYGVRSVKDRLVTFNEATSEDIFAGISGSPVRTRLVEVALDTLQRGGIDVTEARIDDQGIISWQGNKRSRLGQIASVSGTVGQIFDVGSRGEIITKFASGENYMLVPGYEARISAQRPGEELSVEERTKLRGYEQVMAEQIRYQITSDLMVQRSVSGDPTSLNGAYRQLYEERLPLDFWDKAQENGLGRGWAEAVVDTLARRVRYPNEMSDTFYEHWSRSRADNPIDLSNDNFDSPIVKSGGRNMAIIAESARGYFDPDMTNGSHMGTTFYLCEGAQVNAATGQIIPSADLDDKAPLMKHPEMKYASFDAWDRRLMTSSILLHGTRVSEPEVVSFTDVLKGWTADDGVVISKEFAERNTMLTRSGQSRPLIVGDKVADMHGNKGVVGLIVDPQMDLGEAEAEGIDGAVKLFQANPDLSIVMSPFSGVSRFNGGTAREVMDGKVEDLVLPDGQVVPSGRGQMRFVITNKDVEAGTRFYDDSAIAKGSGRRASAQLAWALGGKNATALMADFYGPNSSATANLREHLIFMGLDLGPDGTLLAHRQEETSAQRRILEMPEVVLTARGTIHAAAMRRAFGEVISDRGGDLLIPFPLSLANGDKLEEFEGKFRLPVLSSHLRAGQELDDGTVAAHDYTNQYMAIYQAAYKYEYALEGLKDESISPQRRQTLEALLTSAPRDAQSAYDTIARGIRDRQFSGRHNAFKESIMSSRLANSATAVWTADPRLQLGQVAMGRELAKGLGVKDGQEVMLWRDPVLRDGGVRAMEVVIDDRLTGVAVHPAVTKSFDGDFDGDSVGIALPSSRQARQEAHDLFSMGANLVDLGARTKIEVNGDEIEVYPLAFHEALDTKVSEHFNPELAQRFVELTLAANDLQSDYDANEISTREFVAKGGKIVDQLSDFYATAFSPESQSVTLRFGDTKDHVQSVIEACVETGAKGSMSKVMSYASYAGIDPDTLQDAGKSLHTRKEDEGVMVAVTVKTAVGIAGAYSQRGVKALRNDDVKAVAELTYPVTQAQLQAKHDPKEAMKKYEALMGPGRSLWRGRAMEQAGDGSWQPVRDAKGREIQATPQNWAKTFVAMYSDPNGFGVSVNPEYVDSVAEKLCGPDGKMVDIENVRDGVEAGRGSTLDRLAYGGTWADVMKAAANGENLFSGKLTSHFAPIAIRRNWKAKENFAIAMERRADPTREVAPAVIEQISVSDVLNELQDGTSTRGANRRSERAWAVNLPRAHVELMPVFSDKQDDMEIEGP